MNITSIRFSYKTYFFVVSVRINAHHTKQLRYYIDRDLTHRLAYDTKLEGGIPKRYLHNLNSFMAGNYYNRRIRKVILNADALRKGYVQP